MAVSHLIKFIKRKPSLYFCSIRLTSMCSQNCLQCSIPAQSDGSFIDPATFAQIAAKLKAHGTRVLTFTGGEPALHPQLEEVFSLAQKQGFRNLELLTNLYYPEKQQERVIELAMRYGVRIHTSFDAFGNTADYLRGAKDVQNTVERGMRMINELRTKGLFRFKPTATVVLSALNIKDLPQIIRHIESMDWNLNIDLYRWGSANHKEDDLLKIKDHTQIRDAIQIIRRAKNLRTPLWYYDGLLAKMNGKLKKQCPYLISPTFGSKFFVHENGDLYTCMNKIVGNLLQDELEDIFLSPQWQELKEDFQNCPGCWNTCYTPSSRALSYLDLSTIRQYLLAH